MYEIHGEIKTRLALGRVHEMASGGSGGGWIASRASKAFRTVRLTTGVLFVSTDNDVHVPYNCWIQLH